MLDRLARKSREGNTSPSPHLPAPCSWERPPPQRTMGKQTSGEEQGRSGRPLPPLPPPEGKASWAEGRACGSGRGERLVPPLKPLVGPSPSLFWLRPGARRTRSLMAHPLLADNSPQSVTVSQLRGAPERRENPSPPGAPSACAVNIGFHRRSFGLYLTLFSKSFSPFPRGTCVISVSGRYLALEGSHLPTSRCTPKQRYSRTVFTLLSCPQPTGKRYGTVTLYGAAFWAVLHLPPCYPLRCRGAPVTSRLRRQSLTPHLAPRVKQSHDSGLGLLLFARRYWGDLC